MAICVITVSGAAPCRCFSPGAIQTTSPGWISPTAPSSRCTRPRPKRTINVRPSGGVCQAVRAPGSKVTAAPAPPPGALASKGGSIRTAPVNPSTLLRAMRSPTLALAATTPGFSTEGGSARQSSAIVQAHARHALGR
jgi:hypothetical protein